MINNYSVSPYTLIMPYKAIEDKPAALYQEKEWEVIRDAFNQLATKIHPVAQLIREHPEFDRVKHHSINLRFKLAQQRYIYWECVLKYEKIKNRQK